jgi:predicted O-methyltransferase YrrM
VGSSAHALPGVGSIRARIRILSATYLNHRFERRSPLQAAPAAWLERIYDETVVMPPRRYVTMPGTQTADGLYFLASCVRALGCEVVFEIGTFTGVSTANLALNAERASVHTLDIPPEQAPSLDTERSDIFRAGETGAGGTRMVYEELGATNVVQHWGDSASFDFAPFAGRCDLVYIDGAHSAPYVRSDTANALSMLSERGAVVWDDYWRQSPGVTQVLHELATDPGLRLYRVPETRLVLHLTEGAETRLTR